jgi:hypothetical protein
MNMDRMRLRLVLSRRPWTCSIFLACTLLCVAACDPGYDYRPVGWQRSDRKWTWSDKNLEIRMFPVGSLSASDGLIPEIVVRDLAGRPIVVEGSTLITKRRHYSASIATKDLRYRTVKPGGTLRMPIFSILTDQSTKHWTSRFRWISRTALAKSSRELFTSGLSESNRAERTRMSTTDNRR